MRLVATLSQSSARIAPDTGAMHLGPWEHRRQNLSSSETGVGFGS